ncbi:MAG: class I SAM-dependent methyltransferase [Elusimicrobia bacterium]|nr:class I SAM-dependent methyltransferase [Elusimicrobiota bacterium]
MTSFESVTEVEGGWASQEQVAMIASRYRLAANLASGKDVLEVACGSGRGLSTLGQRARRVVAGDLMESLLAGAQRHYRGRYPLVRFDAMHLPFRDQSFDVVVLFEALYYIPQASQFVREAKRILRPGGALLISSVNCDWSGFNPSPFSVQYYNAATLVGLLSAEGMLCEPISAGFPAVSNGLRASLISKLKKMAVALRLIPKTMKGKVLLKRIFFGKLIRLTAELDPAIPAVPPVIPLENKTHEYKIIYAVARKPA